MRPRRRKRFKQHKERKGIYILPNLFTSASLFGGFYAIIAAIEGRYESAAAAIIISAVFDGLDGRIARFTQTTSHFGTEFDSLSDVIAFGVAPGVLAFLWAMKPFGRFGWLAAFLYVICGALRLARFNVQKSIQDVGFFKGLPIPSAACLIAALVLVADDMGGFPGNTPFLILLITYMLSFLMVSAVAYPSFKKFDIKNQKPFNVLVAVILICIVIAYKPSIMLFLCMSLYIVSGPIISGHRLYARRSTLMKTDHDLPSVPADESDKSFPRDPGRTERVHTN